MTAKLGITTQAQREQLAMFVQLNGLPVRFSPMLLPRTTEAWLLRPQDDPFGITNRLQLVMFSETALLYALAGIVWHDEPDHCRAWVGDSITGSCRCDLGEES